jgi:tetratricopeptide (TPR) repeat protein
MKSSAPRQSQSTHEDAGEYERLRGIEREYELEIVAEHPRQLIQFQAVSLRVLSGHASRTLSHLAALTGSTQASAGDVRAIVSGVDTLGLGAAAGMQGDSDDEGGMQTVLVDLFDRVAKQYFKEQRILRQIAGNLRDAYEAPFLGMRNEAEKWLVSGMKRAGRDRDEDFNDALRLLRASIDSPFGNGDYVAWFQLGWLLWQHERNVVDAEDAFYKAQRLSAATNDLYYLKSLRHLAYMQYLRGNYTAAYDTVHKALDINPDHETRIEAARYAAMLGGNAESIRLLEQCIRERPTTIISMFAEGDFLRAPESSKLLGLMAELAALMLAEARSRTAKNLQHWRMGLMVVDSAEKLIGHKITTPDDVGQKAIDQMPDVAQADYLLALEIDRRSLAAGDKVLHVARDVLKGEVRETTSVLGKAQGELEKLEFAAKRRMHEAHDWKEEQVGEMPSLMKTLRGKGIGLNLLFPVIGVILEMSGLPIVRAVLQIPKDQPTFQYNGNVPAWILLSYACMSWVLFSYIVFALAQLGDLLILQSQRAKIERVYNEVIRVDEAQSSGELGALRKMVWEATRRKQRAEEALRLIEP